MIGTLLRKQLSEFFSFITIDKRGGKKRSVKGIVGFSILYLYLIVMLLFSFYTTAKSMAPIIGVGFGWMYMSIMAMVAIFVGTFTCIFTAYASIYRAKDNDLLLSMPIKSSTILFSRLFTIYIIAFAGELLVMIPTIVVYFKNAKPNIMGIVFTVLIPIVLSMFILTLACVLGFLIAAITSRIRYKNAVTIVLSLAFLIGYYYIFSKTQDMLKKILENPAHIGKKIKSYVYPLYHMGKAAEGKVLSMVIFTAIFAVSLFIVLIVLERSFLKLATANSGNVKVKYKEKTLKSSSVELALFKKELAKFTSSALYMLNCGLGTVFMLGVSVLLLVKRSTVMGAFNGLPGVNGNTVYFIATLAICILISMNYITAPSVSLEGKNIWIAQSLPVPASTVLWAKARLHLALTLPPAGVLVLVALIVLKPTLSFMLLIPATAVIYAIFSALSGLFFNLKMPNLNWKSEAIPIKQSMPTMLSVIGGMAVPVAIGALYFAIDKWISPELYLLAVATVLLILSVALTFWISKRGAQIFENL